MMIQIDSQKILKPYYKEVEIKLLFQINYLADLTLMLNAIMLNKIDIIRVNNFSPTITWQKCI